MDHCPSYLKEDWNVQKKLGEMFNKSVNIKGKKPMKTVPNSCLLIKSLGKVFNIECFFQISWHFLKPPAEVINYTGYGVLRNRMVPVH